MRLRLVTKVFLRAKDQEPYNNQSVSAFAPQKYGYPLILTDKVF